MHCLITSPLTTIVYIRSGEWWEIPTIYNQEVFIDFSMIPTNSSILCTYYFFFVTKIENRSERKIPHILSVRVFHKHRYHALWPTKHLFLNTGISAFIYKLTQMLHCLIIHLFFFQSHSESIDVYLKYFSIAAFS